MTHRSRKIFNKIKVVYPSFHTLGDYTLNEVFRFKFVRPVRNGHPYGWFLQIGPFVVGKEK